MEANKRYTSDANDWHPSKRVEYMRQDGVDAEVLYPNYAMRAFAVADPELQLAVCRAYNDWIGDFCQTHPQELFGVAVISALDVPWAMAECRRPKDKGLVGILLPQDTPDGSRYSAPQWDPLWATLHDVVVEFSAPGQQLARIAAVPQ